MTHMHIPDGILPVGLWILGFVVMFLAMGISLLRLKDSDLKKKIPLLGALSAVMLVAMSIEILPLAYHINLSVVAGILLGPALGFLAAFIANLMLALMGHGGITVIANTILLDRSDAGAHSVYLLHASAGLLACRRRCGVDAVYHIILIGIVAASHVDPNSSAMVGSMERHEGAISIPGSHP
jgi:ABC-type Co2+ transport system permease subunit